MKKTALCFLVVLLALLNPISAQVFPDTAFNSLLRQNNGGWIAGDATFSISLPDQKTLWLFGDSFIGTANPDSSIASGASFIRNCAVLQIGDSMQALFGGTFSNPIAFAPSVKPDSAWYWPEHGMIENDTLKIFLSEFVEASGPAGFNFKYNSLYIARYTYPDIVLVDIKKLPYYDLNGVCYGNSVLVEDGYTYIYGRKESDTIYHIPYPHVARAVAGSIMGPWEFFDGSNWVSTPESSIKISPTPVSQQFGVFKLGYNYVLVSQEIWFSTKIQSFTSGFLHGPFVNKTLLYQTPILYSNTFTYNAFPHIQFHEDDKLLISYNSNGNFWDIFSNVEIYRPLFIRVPFTMIDPTYVSVKELQQKKTDSESVLVYQNYPNPAVDHTKVKFVVSKKSFVSLHLNNNEGKLLQTYVNKFLDSGAYEVELDLHDLKSGIYTYSINNICKKLIKK